MNLRIFLIFVLFGLGFSASAAKTDCSYAFSNKAHWTKVEIGFMGLPRSQLESAALIRKNAAFFLVDALDLNRTEEVVGQVIRVPIWGTDQTSYDVKLQDGTTRSINNLHAVRKIRFDLSSR